MKGLLSEMSKYLEMSRVAGKIDRGIIMEFKPAPVITFVLSTAQLLQIVCMGLMWYGFAAAFERINPSYRAAGAWIEERKGYVLLITFVLPIILNSLSGIGSAFEIFLGEELIFSGLKENGHLSLQRVYNILRSKGI
eukprot:GHVO01043958.1.p2 GENE.GHVO01043958.1~~GHVO01043958.1.p2  ORF type:complete len:137 (+),score=16.63 GHVO01043958.1:245-655(+)